MNELFGLKYAETGIIRLRYWIIAIVIALIYLMIKIFHIKKEYYIQNINNKLIIFFTILISISLTNITFQKYKNFNSIKNFENKKLFSMPDRTKHNPLSIKKPDIYYIILDMYTSSDALKKFHFYDNSWFINKLKKQGFYIAEQSKSNYPCTGYSLSSSINMKYHKKYSTPSNIEYFRYLVKNNNLVNILEENNYKCFNIKSSIAISQFDYRNNNSFKNFNASKFCKSFLANFDLLASFLLQKTFLHYFDKPILKFIYKNHSYKILDQIKELKEISKINGPKFIFCHILCPHPPYVFDCNGINLSENFLDHKNKYSQQVHFISKKILPTIKYIINKSEEKPIIILQGDHGFVADSAFLGLHSQYPDNLYENINSVFSILNAYYFPEKEYESLYREISPVNSFRIVLNKYLGYEIKKKINQSFMCRKSNNRLLEIINVNKILESNSRDKCKYELNNIINKFT